MLLLSCIYNVLLLDALQSKGGVLILQFDLRDHRNEYAVMRYCLFSLQTLIATRIAFTMKKELRPLILSIHIWECSIYGHIVSLMSSIHVLVPVPYMEIPNVINIKPIGLSGNAHMDLLSVSFGLCHQSSSWENVAAF